MVITVDITYLVDINGVSSKLFYANGSYHSNRRGEIIKAATKNEFREKMVKRYGLTDLVANQIISKFD